MQNCPITQELEAWLKSEAEDEALAEAKADALYKALTDRINFDRMSEMLYEFYTRDLSETELRWRLKGMAEKELDALRMGVAVESSEDY